MKASRKFSKFAISVLAFALATGSASASVLFSFDESGGNVVGTLSGSLDLTGATSSATSVSSSNEIWPFRAIVVSGIASASSLDGYTVTGPYAFGSNLITLASSSTGSAFFLSPYFNIVGLPQGYSSGADLSGTLSFAGATFASLDITPGDYVYTLPHDSITLRFGSAATPLPAALPLFASGLGGLGLLGWRRRKKRTPLAA